MRCEGPVNEPCNRCRASHTECIFEKPAKDVGVNGNGSVAGQNGAVGVGNEAHRALVDDVTSIKEDMAGLKMMLEMLIRQQQQQQQISTTTATSGISAPLATTRTGEAPNQAAAYKALGPEYRQQWPGDGRDMLLQPRPAAGPSTVATRWSPVESQGSFPSPPTRRPSSPTQGLVSTTRGQDADEAGKTAQDRKEEEDRQDGEGNEEANLSTSDRHDRPMERLRDLAEAAVEEAELERQLQSKGRANSNSSPDDQRATTSASEVDGIREEEEEGRDDEAVDEEEEDDGEEDEEEEEEDEEEEDDNGQEEVVEDGEEEGSLEGDEKSGSAVGKADDGKEVNAQLQASVKRKRHENGVARSLLMRPRSISSNSLSPHPGRPLVVQHQTMATARASKRRWSMAASQQLRQQQKKQQQQLRQRLLLGQTDASGSKHLLTDVVSQGLVQEDEAKRLWDLFYQGCPQFIGIFHLDEEHAIVDQERSLVKDSRADTFDAIRRRSPFLFSTILFVGGRVDCGACPAKPAFVTCRDRARLHVEKLLNRPRDQLIKEDVMALLLIASYSDSDTAWRHCRTAVTVAQELGLDRAFTRLKLAIKQAQFSPSNMTNSAISEGSSSSYGGSAANSPVARQCDVQSEMTKRTTTSRREGAGRERKRRRASKLQQAHAFPDGSLEQQRELAGSARIWFFCYLFEHQISYCSGQPAMVNETCVAGLREFLDLPEYLRSSIDARFLSTVELMVLRERYLSILEPKEAPIDDRMLADFYKMEKMVNDWLAYWSRHFQAKGHHFDSFFQGSLHLQAASVKLYLCNSSVRHLRPGVSLLQKVDRRQRELVRKSIHAAFAVLETAVRHENYWRLLRWAPHYTVVTLVFALSHLLDCVSLFTDPDLLDVAKLFAHAEQLGTRLRQLPFFKYSVWIELRRRKVGQIVAERNAASAAAKASTLSSAGSPPTVPALACSDPQRSSRQFPAPPTTAHPYLQSQGGQHVANWSSEQLQQQNQQQQQQQQQPQQQVQQQHPQQQQHLHSQRQYGATPHASPPMTATQYLQAHSLVFPDDLAPNANPPTAISPSTAMVPYPNEMTPSLPGQVEFAFGSHGLSSADFAAAGAAGGGVDIFSNALQLDAYAQDSEFFDGIFRFEVGANPNL